MGKLNKKDATGRTVTLTGVRISFGDSLDVASLPKGNTDPNAKPKHGVNLIMERGSADFDSNNAALEEAMSNACEHFKKKRDWWKSLKEDNPDKLFLKEGRRFKNSDGEIYQGYEGNLALAIKGPAAGAKRPQIRDRNKTIVHDPVTKPDTSRITEVAYNGAYCDAIVSVYGSNGGGTDRITASVEAIRSHERGDRMGGGGIYVDDDDFDDMEDDASFDDGPDDGSNDDLI